MCRALIAILLTVLLVPQAEARSVRSRVITTIPLENLVARSSVIAQVRIVAVDEEIASAPIARARVEHAFKGAEVEDVLILDATTVADVGAVFLVFLDETNQKVGSRLLSNVQPCAVDPEAPYYVIHEGLARQMPVRLTWSSGSVDVAVSFPAEDVPLPNSLTQTLQSPPDRAPEILVQQDEIYRAIRGLLKPSP